MPVTTLSIPNGNSIGSQTGETGNPVVDPTLSVIRNNSTSTNRRHLGIRFTPPATGDIPKGATINSATFTLSSAHATLDDINCDVYGHAVDNSPSFEVGTGTPDVYGRAYTSATVNWQVVDAVINTGQNLDVTSIVQEIVNRSGWNEASITLLFIGKFSGTENYQGYGRTGTYPPALSVDWSAAGVTGDVNVTLSGATITSAGDVLVEGVGDVTLPGASLSAVGTVGGEVTGAVGVTLDSAPVSASGTVTSTGGSAVPTIEQNTPDDAVFSIENNITLEFTGHDDDPLENLRYQVQISSNSGFTNPSTLRDNFVSGGGGMAIHPQPHASFTTWLGDPQVDDRPGQSFTAYGDFLDKISVRLVYDQGNGSYPDGYAIIRVYEHQGTYGTSSAPLNPASPANTPTPDWIAVSDPIIFTPSMSTSAQFYDFLFTELNRIKLVPGAPYVFILDWVPYVRDDVNTWAASGDAINSGTLHTGNLYIDGFSTNNNGPRATWDLYFRVYEQALLLDKTSGTDPGFSNVDNPLSGEPYRQGQKIQYTIPEDVLLANNSTYYWRVRAIDPYGSNTYSDWSATRTFVLGDVTEGSVAVTLDGATVSATGLLSHTLVSNSTEHAHTADNVVLSQSSLLEVGDATHGHTATPVVLTQAHALQVSGSVHSHVADNLDLFQAHTVSVQETEHGHSADAPVILQSHFVLVQDTLHVVTVESAQLTQAHVLSVTDASHGHVIDNVTLSQMGVLGVEDTSHAHLADNIVLTQAHILSVFSATHAHLGDDIAVVQVHNVLVQRAEHSHAASSVLLVQSHNLSAHDSLHAHLSDHVVLSQANELSVGDSLHTHTADTISVTQSHYLSVQDASHSHAAANVVFTQAYHLLPVDAVHAHASDNVEVTTGTLLFVADTVHVHTTANVELLQAHDLAVSDTVHYYVSNNVDLSVTHVLSADSATHAHTSDEMTVSVQYALTVSDALHSITSGMVTLTTVSLSGQHAYIEASVSDLRLTATVLSDRSDHQVGFIVRVSDLNNFIAVYLVVDEGLVCIEKVEASVRTLLTSVPVPLVRNTPYTLQVTADGALIGAYVNGYLVATSTSFNQSATKHGVRVHPGTWIDNFQVYVKEA